MLASSKTQLHPPSHAHQSYVVTYIITRMNITRIDLNLFVVLQAVLDERSATRAAARLHVTQSAVSNALARLRSILGDQLVVRTRRGLMPTPRALQLQPQLEAALTALEGVTRESTFELRSSTREWAMSFAEHYAPLLLPTLARRLRDEAPNTSLRVIALERMFATDALATGDIDLYLGIPGRHPAAWRMETLFEDETVGVMQKHHPLARARMTLDRFAALPHVQARIVPERGREVDDALARVGRSRRIAVVVPHFGAVFPVVAASDCVAAVSRRLALYYAKQLPIRIFTLPIELPRLAVGLYWHVRADADPGVRALRGIVRDIFA